MTCLLILISIYVLSIERSILHFDT